MPTLKTYSIAAMTNGLNLSRLHTEILNSSAVTLFTGINTAGDNLDIQGDSLANEPGLDTLITAHELETLAEYKQARYNAIDYKTGYLIHGGFTYDSKQFSLSANAQANWNALHSNPTEFTWPQEITAINNDTYSLAEANLNAFWEAGKVVLADHLGTGRALKKSIFDAADKTAVNAIVDTR